jgi:hypothetical protein
MYLYPNYTAGHHGVMAPFVMMEFRLMEKYYLDFKIKYQFIRSPQMRVALTKEM